MPQAICSVPCAAKPLETIMQITPAMKQAAMAKAKQLLAIEMPKYKFVGNNATALEELENCIADTAVRLQRLAYTKWAAGVEVQLPNGQVAKVPRNYGRTPMEPVVNEFLRYLALKSCEEFGFLQTYCIVNKGGDSKDKPSDSFFALAEEVGLLAEDDQDEAGRDAFLQIQKNTGFGHKWPTLGACKRCWPGP